MRTFSSLVAALATLLLAGTLIAASPAVSPASIVEPAAWSFVTGQAQAGGGICFANAGDVNGDGYSDVLVGAKNYSNGSVQEGRAFLFLGSASGLGAVAAWTAEGDQIGAHFGYSVAGAGDLNGDGYDDIVIGAPDLDVVDPGTGDLLANAGDAFVYFGSATGPAGTPDYRVTSAGSIQAGAQRGFSVGGSGDINGDGYDDMAVGAPGYDFSVLTEDAGLVQVFTGAAGGFPSAVIGRGAGFHDQLGIMVAPAGDVNSDGYDDLAISGPHQVWVYHGHDFGLIAAPEWNREDLGGVVIGVGDVNGDGYADVGVGSPSDAPGGSGYDPCPVLTVNEPGKSRVFLGSAAGLAADPFFETCGSSIVPAGDVNGDGFADVIQYRARTICSCDNPACVLHGLCGLTPGALRVLQGSPSGLTEAWLCSIVELGAFSMAAAGDVNADGYSDILVGQGAYSAPGLSEEGIVYLFSGAASSLAPDPGFATANGQPGMGAGYSVAGVGDVDGDGYGDFAVGAPLWDGPEVDEGRIVLLPGGPFAGQLYQSNQAGADYGLSVAGAGDVNGDGYGDIIVGAPTFSDGEAAEGAAFVLMGTPDLSEFPVWTAEGNQAGAWFGYSVASAGDVNADGYADVLIGAPLYDNGEADEGSAFLYLGSATGLVPVSAWSAESNQAGAHFGWSVAGAGDVNRDGRSDVIIGAPLFSNGQASEGCFYVYHGHASNLNPTPSVVRELDQAGGRLGWSVAGAGDVNGDGFSDIAVGAPYADLGQTDEGLTFVCHGSAAGVVVAPPAWLKGSDQDFGLFGSSVSAGGDVNGDGYGDLLVGAKGYSNGQADEGRAYLFHGSAAGLALTPGWTDESDQVDGGFGFSVASAGDVNGDGYGDVLIGAPLWDAAASEDTGRGWLYYGNASEGLLRGPAIRQMRGDDSAPIALLGRTEDHQFRIEALGRTPEGRGLIGLEWELKPLGTAFDGDVTATALVRTAAPAGAEGSTIAFNELIGGLAPGSAHHWRMRIARASRLSPYSPWVSIPGNASTETDLRDAFGVLSVPGLQLVDNGVHLERGAPNPFQLEATLQFTLPARSAVDLSIFDLSGRRFATLVNEERAAGRHAVVWDGKDSRGNAAAPGMYVVRLRAGTSVHWTKLIRLQGPQ